MEGMREADYFPCPSMPQACPYSKNGCYEDIHHEYQIQERMTRLMRIFRNLPRNTIVTCRHFHTTVLDRNPKEYPSDEEMKNEIIDADLSGEVCLSNNKRKTVYGNT